MIRGLGAAALVLVSLAPAPQSAWGRPADVAFRFDQVGYLPDASKRVLAMVARPVASRRFVVREDAHTPRGPDAHGPRGGRVVAVGRANGPARWNARRLVYALDVTALRAPGRYAIEFAGARSRGLRVASGAMALYGRLGENAVSFLQVQRDGPEVLRGRLRTAPAHLRDAAAAVYAVPRYKGMRLRGRLMPTGARIDASGGWFDAGDYLKFVQTASFTDAALLFALRSFPGGLGDRAALAAEARFGTDWLLRMWDEREGVLYYQVGIGDGNGGSILGDHDLWRLPQADDGRRLRRRSPVYFETYRPVFAANAPGMKISPNLAGRVAAAFALCAQVFAASDPAYAQRCLMAGQRVYDRADTDPRGELTTSSPYAYYDETAWRDDMEFGATELYLATREALQAPIGSGGLDAAALPHTDLGWYLERAGVWANAYMDAPESGQDSLNLYDVSTFADYDLVRILDSPLAQDLQGDAGVEVPTDTASILRDRGEQLRRALALARSEPFGMANPAGSVDTTAHALGYAVEARMYDALAHTRAFEPFAQSQLDWVLGANAWGSSFVVGAGRVFPRCLASQIPNLRGSLNGHGAILRGAAVEGPSTPASLRHLSEPEGARRCSARGPDGGRRRDGGRSGNGGRSRNGSMGGDGGGGGGERYAALSGHGLAYVDDVRSPTTSEPTDDLAALTLLASSQAAAGG